MKQKERLKTLIINEPNRVIKNMLFYQFKMKIKFDFFNTRDPAEGYFYVGEDLKRKVPLEVEGIEGLNTVYMFFPESDLYLADEVVIVDCCTIAPQLYRGKIKPGLKGKLWESGYFADVEILEVNDKAFI